MLNNNPKLKDYEDPKPDDILKVKSKVENKVKFIAEKVIKKENYKENDTDGIGFSFSKSINILLERLILFATFIVEYTNINNYFYVDSKCVGCGICEKVCSSQKIKIVDKKPIWQKQIKCYLCYACLNYCPESSIHIKNKIYMKSYTKEKGRYPHPFATLKEIIEQKSL